MELRLLRYFIAVAEERSFTAAARRLRLSQPSLSQQIQLLERRMGVTLLDRAAHPMQLTPAGQHLFDAGRQLLEAADELVNATRRRGSASGGELRIGVVKHGLYDLVQQAIAHVRTIAPDARLPVRQFAGTAQLAALRRSAIDLMLYRHTHTTTFDDLHVLPLFDDPMIAMAPSGHPVIENGAVALHRLEEYPLVLVRRDSMPIAYDRTLAACRDAGFEPSAIIEIEEPYTMALTVANGSGIGLTGAGMADRYPGIDYVPVTPRSGTAEISAVWRVEAPNPLREIFLDGLLEALRNSTHV